MTNTARTLAALTDSMLRPHPAPSANICGTFFIENGIKYTAHIVSLTRVEAYTTGPDGTLGIETMTPVEWRKRAGA